MKKNKLIALICIIIGVILICSAIILAIIKTADKYVIGGADFSSFLFVFFKQSGGIYSILSLCGIALLILGTIVLFVKSNK
ncbi:MAG: hypothetical protein J6M03_03735 [Clostridia bacterium]|nr:hypothetical protein [Clostridia bacterium]